MEHSPVFVMLAVTMGLFLFAASSDPKVMTDQQVKDKVTYCYKHGGKPWFTFVEQGNKESGVRFIDCVPKDYTGSDNSPTGLDLDDDSTVGVPGFGMVTGIPGSPM